jgi:hypothetical protein
MRVLLLVIGGLALAGVLTAGVMMVGKWVRRSLDRIDETDRLRDRIERQRVKLRKKEREDDDGQGY